MKITALYIENFRGIRKLDINPGEHLTVISGIVLIDEIDLHLHPSWQREVIDKLLHIFPNCQFVITSHSPHVIASVNRIGGHSLVASLG